MFESRRGHGFLCLGFTSFLKPRCFPPFFKKAFDFRIKSSLFVIPVIDSLQKHRDYYVKQSLKAGVFFFSLSGPRK